MLKKVSARVLATVLAIVMVVGLFPLSAFAATTNYPDFLANLKQLEVYADEFA